MQFRIDFKIDGPWIPCAVTKPGQYTSTSQMVNFLAWFRHLKPGTDFRAKRLWTPAQIATAEEICRGSSL